MTSLETSDEDYRDPELYFRTADAAFEAICSIQLCIGHVEVKTRSHGRGKHGFDTHIDVITMPKQRQIPTALQK